MTVFRGVTLEDRAVFPESAIVGKQKVSLIERLNRKTQSLFETSHEMYTAQVGEENKDFLIDYANAPVLPYYNNVMVEDTPLRLAESADLTQDVALDRVISGSTESFLLFINGYACYTGVGASNSMTPFTSNVATTERDKGYLMIGIPNGSLLPFNLLVDRVKMTFQKLGGGTIEVWMSLKKGIELDDEDIVVWDKNSTGYGEIGLSKENFLSSFILTDTDQVDSGAIINELHMVRGYGLQTVASLNFRNATDFDLSHVGERWFGIPKREGETDKNYIDRIVSTVIGEKCIPFAIKKALAVFSPAFVHVLEGIKNYAYVGRSFVGFDQDLVASGSYNGIVKPAFIGSRTGGLMFVRVQIEDNAVTSDPINARFIFELVDSILMGGVAFEIQKI